MTRKIAFVLVATLVLPCTAKGVQADSANVAGPTARQRAPIRPLHDFAWTAADLGRDFWRSLSAPAWMDGGAWIKTAGVLAVGGLLYLTDEDITRAATRNLEEPVFREINDVGTFLEPIGLMGNTNVWYASGAVVSYFLRLDRPKRMFTEMLYSHWIAGIIRGGTNKLVGRERPYKGLGSSTFVAGEGTSFPSGHASTIFQVAAVLSHHIHSTPVSIGLYGLATTVAYQRITSEEHWASDVWLGAVYGWAVAQLVIRLHEDEALRLEPFVDGSGAAGMALRVRM